MMHLQFYQYQRHEENIKYLNRIPEVFSQRSEFAPHKALSYLELEWWRKATIHLLIWLQMDA